MTAALAITPAAQTVRVAVSPDKFGRGLEAPGHRGHTYDWREEGPRNSREIRARFEVANLADALERRYRSDAHLVTYYVVDPRGRPLDRQPRVNKGGLGWLLEQGYQVEHDVLMVDVDNPLHQEWTPALMEQFSRTLEAPVLSTAGLYLTRAGWRIIQALDEPVSASEAERYLAAWIEELADYGIEADRACVDWTRLFRLPHVKRGPMHYTSPLVDVSRLTPRLIHPKAWAGPRGRHAPARCAA